MPLPLTSVSFLQLLFLRRVFCNAVSIPSSLILSNTLKKYLLNISSMQDTVLDAVISKKGKDTLDMKGFKHGFTDP